MGDININLLCLETCKYAQILLSLQSFSLIPTIDKPTRIYNNTATLIDNIFTNTIDNGLISGNIVSDISYHFSQFCIASSRTKIFKNSKGQNQVKRDFSDFSDVKFNNELSALNLNDVAENSNYPTKSFPIFYNKLHKLIKKLVSEGENYKFFSCKHLDSSGVARVIILGVAKCDRRRREPCYGGSGGMLPREILKSRVPQMRFPPFCG